MRPHGRICEPRLESPAVYVPSFKVSLQAGHFVKAYIEGIFYVGRIINTSLLLANVVVTERSDRVMNDVEASQPGFVKINWFYPQELLNFAHLDIAAASSNIYLTNNIELFQTKGFSWLSTSQISELCFVFYYIDVVDGKYCCEGMSNTFFVHYHYGAQRVEPISNVENSYCAFPLFIPEFSLQWSYCWSSEVWESLMMMVQQAITGLCVDIPKVREDIHQDVS